MHQENLDHLVSINVFLFAIPTALHKIRFRDLQPIAKINLNIRC